VLQDLWMPPRVVVGEWQTVQGDYIHRLAIDLRNGTDPVKD
jgi:hypothetical protein